MPVRSYATGNRTAVERLLILKAPQIDGVYYLLDDLLNHIGDRYTVAQAVVALREQCQIDVSTATLYRWRKDLRENGASL